MSQIQISDLTFSYDGSFEPVFERVSLTVDTDWRLGLIGRNGRGKTTLLRLLCGELEYRGTIASSVRFCRFPQPVTDPARPVREILHAAAPDAMDWQLECELNELALDADVIDRPFSTLSGGEQTKVLLAALFLDEGRFPLIDEPTNHLDEAAREQVAQYLRRKDGFLLVSHDRAFLDRAVDHILSINRTGLEIQAGNFSSWWANKQRQDAHERAENERLRGEIGRLTAAARRTADWSDAVEKTKIGGGKQASGLRPDRGAIGHKSAKMMKRAKAIEARRLEAAEEKSKLLKNVETTDPLFLTPLSHHASRLVEAHDLTIRYDGKALLGGLRFELRPGDRIALRGPNGCGKSSLLKLIAGEALDYAGTLRCASGLTCSYVPQDTLFLSGRPQDYAQACGIDQSRYLTLLRKLDFPRALFERDMATYSAGQKKKALLARSLCEQAHLYLWDEPLNFIDIFSRMQLEDLLTETNAALLFVEHDRMFTDRVATGIIELGRP